MNLHPWQPAVDAQLAAYRLSDYLMKHDKRSELNSGWRIDKILLEHATPFMWSTETMNAVLQASKSIPLDTILNKWSLPTERCWWWFETPLPFETLSVRTTSGVRALAFGFIPLQPEKRKVYPPGTPLTKINSILEKGYMFGMPIVCWLDPESNLERLIGRSFGIAPSQVFEWEDNQTLGEMLDATRRGHVALYGPGGKWEKKPQLDLEEFMRTTEGVARFMLAAFAWLRQKIAVRIDSPVERHRRKEAEKVLGRKLSSVQVVSLRNAERREDDDEEENDLRERRHYDKHQWVVDGHWRQQVCGPGRMDRRPIWIMPFLKGPEGAPMLEKKTKVFTVDR